MLLYASCYGEDVGVHDDVIGVKVQLVDEQVVGTSADLHFAFSGSSLEMHVRTYVCMYSGCYHHAYRSTPQIMYFHNIRMYIRIL